MKETKFRAKAKSPTLSREESVDGHEGYEFEWLLLDLEKDHGGMPLIEGVVSVDVTEKGALIPRYKVVYPDGYTDYMRVDIFGSWFDYELAEEEGESNEEESIS